MNSSENENNLNIIGDYYLKETIGKGTFSKVKLGINKNTKEKVAIKLLKKSKIIEKDDLERIIREMSIYKIISHENVIEVYDMFETNDYYMIIMKYYEKGELFNYIVENEKLTENETAYFFYQIINGIEYIHNKGIAHRDLKPENLLLDKDKKLKIIDFGLSNYFDEINLLKTPCGSPCYASPEMVSGKKYNGFLIDIWAIGIILYAMLCGYLPFEDDNNDILFKKILKCKLDYPKDLSSLSKDIMNKILVTDPKKRINIQQIKQHQFYILGKRIYEEKFKNSLKDNDEESVRKSYTANHTNENIALNEIDNEKKEINKLINIGYNPIKIKSNEKKITVDTNNKKDEVNVNLFSDYTNNRSIHKNNKSKKIPKMYIIKGEKKEEKRTKTQTNSVIQNNTKNKIINNFNRSKINSTIQDDYKVELTDIPKRNNEINFKNGQNDIINIYKISIRNMNNKKILLKPYNNHKFNSNNDNPKNRKYIISEPKSHNLNINFNNRAITKRKEYNIQNTQSNKLPLIIKDNNLKFFSYRIPLATDINLDPKIFKNKIKLKGFLKLNNNKHQINFNSIRGKSSN